MGKKIRLEVLDENMNKMVKEFGLDEIESVIENNDPVVLNAASDTCDDKTLGSIDLPDGIGGGLLHPRILWRRYRLYATYCYPSDAEQALKDAIVSCFETAVKAALVAAGVITFTPAGLSGALPAAQTAFVESFKSCMGDKLIDAIKFDVKYEDHRI